MKEVREVAQPQRRSSGNVASLVQRISTYGIPAGGLGFQPRTSKKSECLHPSRTDVSPKMASGISSRARLPCKPGYNDGGVLNRVDKISHGIEIHSRVVYRGRSPRSCRTGTTVITRRRPTRSRARPRTRERGVPVRQGDGVDVFQNAYAV